MKNLNHEKTKLNQKKTNKNQILNVKSDLIKKSNKQYLWMFLAVCLVIYYFMVPVSIFWDTGHYTSYVSILEGSLPWSSWDIVRGIVFPMFLHLSNLLFGKTTQGILILTFIFYLIMLIFVKKILDNCFKIENEKVKKAIYIGLFTYILIDPIIYGYYHALLTEFIAMTTSIVMCFLSWKWIELDFFKDRKKYIIYSLGFIITTILSWHLKQPYVSAALFPVIMATIISICTNRNLKNVTSRLATTMLCIIGLVLSISVWNSFLASRGVELNSNRNVTSSFGRMLIDGLNNYEIVENNKETKYLTKSEIKKLKNNKNYLLVNIKNPKGKIIDQDILKTDKNGFVPTSTSIKYITTQMFKHPYLVLESYTSTYLAIADVYPKTTETGVSYKVKKKLDFSFCHENCTIAGKVRNHTSNIMYMYEDAYQRVVNYEQINDSPSYLRNLLTNALNITLKVFKIVLLILPFLSVAIIVSILRKKNRDYIRLLSMILILTWYSFLHVLLHVSTGANIDRYASPAYITTILATVLYIYYLIVSKKFSRRSKK